ncbi:MAG: hypothetical protein AB7E32_01310 [Desulfovibrio sp.]
MKVVEGQISMLEFFSKMSDLSHSYASENFREYVKRVAETQKLFADIVPRWVQTKPAVNQDGSVRTDFVDHFQDEGRIFQARS